MHGAWVWRHLQALVELNQLWRLQRVALPANAAPMKNIMAGVSVMGSAGFVSMAMPRTSLPFCTRR